MTKMGSVVGLVHSQVSEKEIKNSISKALDLIEFKPKNPLKSVIIKVNLCYYWQAATGCTTDPRVVAGIIDYIRERYGIDPNIQVAEADATAMRTRHAFLMLGYKKLAKEKNIELLNLSNDRIEKRKVQVNRHEFTFDIPQSLLKCDLFINVPKLKLMRATRITCALKNVFGCIATPRKIVYHPFLDEAIAGVNKILHPHITIVDGLVALGRFPVKLGLIMAGADPFSIDWVASQIMGYNPSKIGFLKVAKKEKKLGNPDSITIRGKPLTTFKKKFPKEGLFYGNWVWGVQFRLLKLYKKIVNDVIPPFLEGS